MLGVCVQVCKGMCARCVCWYAWTWVFSFLTDEDSDSDGETAMEEHGTVSQVL